MPCISFLVFNCCDHANEFNVTKSKKRKKNKTMAGDEEQIREQDNFWTNV